MDEELAAILQANGRWRPMSDEVRKEMFDAYSDGGISQFQQIELGTRRPSLGKFVEFAEKCEGIPFRTLWTFGGLDFVFDYEQDFKKIGIDGQTLAGCMDAEPDLIRQVCLKVLKSLNEAQERAKSGQTQMVSRGISISLTAVKGFVCAVLDAQERYFRYEPIPEFQFLLSYILFPGEPEVDAARSSNDLKMYAGLIAGAYRHKHGKLPSYRKLAELFNVAPSTISRLFENEAEYDRCATIVLISDPSSHPALRGIYHHL